MGTTKGTDRSGGGWWATGDGVGEAVAAAEAKAEANVDTRTLLLFHARPPALSAAGGTATGTEEAMPVNMPARVSVVSPSSIPVLLLVLLPALLLVPSVDSQLSS